VSCVPAGGVNSGRPDCSRLRSCGFCSLAACPRSFRSFDTNDVATSLVDAVLIPTVELAALCIRTGIDCDEFYDAVAATFDGLAYFYQQHGISSQVHCFLLLAVRVVR
jgi:hypothetical protein